MLEPATDYDNLEPGDTYGNVADLANLRLLLTKSQKDECLTTWYPAASRIANLFRGLEPTPALGAHGPSDKTVEAFGGQAPVSVDSGFTIVESAAAGGRLVVADLTPIHTARSVGNPAAYDGGICGSHSDMFLPEVYNLIGGFFNS